MNIFNKKRFKLAVFEKVSSNKCSYMDAMLLVCEDNGLDPSDIGKLVDDTLKDRLKVEALELNYLKEKSTTLTIPLEE